jgi:hypothetical protein
MLAASSLIPDCLKHDSSVLKLWPDPGDPQHDEQAGGWLKKGLRPLPEDDKTHESGATMHTVLLFNRIAQHRPSNLEKHIDFKQYFGSDAAVAKLAQNPQCIADDIEAKWEKAGYPGRLWRGAGNEERLCQARRRPVGSPETG